MFTKFDGKLAVLCCHFSMRTGFPKFNYIKAKITSFGAFKRAYICKRSLKIFSH